jgi:hypothetical protein
MEGPYSHNRMVSVIPAKGHASCHNSCPYRGERDVEDSDAIPSGLHRGNIVNGEAWGIHCADRKEKEILKDRDD